MKNFIHLEIVTQRFWVTGSKLLIGTSVAKSQCLSKICNYLQKKYFEKVNKLGDNELQTGYNYID